nr:response regulator [uncultured Flavobacterium sp.]
MNKVKTLTLIDDDNVFVFLTTKTIQQTELVDFITVYGNGLDAINFIKENKSKADQLPEIILLDLSMPVMNGWQFLEEFSKLNGDLAKKIPIYICSSSISPADIERAAAINDVADYIVKPITKNKLIEVIHSL